MRNYSRSIVSQTEVENYVNMMKQVGIATIVAMNRYLTTNHLWNRCESLKTFNTYASGAQSIGVSKEAYRKILKLYKTNDVVTTHLVSSKRVA